jgi:hypothetical protein
VLTLHAEIEKSTIERSYFALVKHINEVVRIRGWHVMAEEGVIKWMWGAAGLLLWCASLCPVWLRPLRSTDASEAARTDHWRRCLISSIPVFFPLPGIVKDLGSRTEGFVTNRRLLLSASDAMGRVMYSYKVRPSSLAPWPRFFAADAVPCDLILRRSWPSLRATRPGSTTSSQRSRMSRTVGTRRSWCRRPRSRRTQRVRRPACSSLLGLCR